MYYLVIRQFALTLKNLDACLSKAERYAEARNFPVNNLINARLAPDMLPFVAQIRIACDNAKTAAANLSGKPAPKHEDTEQTFEELHARIGKALAFIDTVSEADLAGTAPDKPIKLVFPPNKALRANEYLVARQIPNFYFHVATAYDILRHNGVDLGKGDYLGDLPLIDAP
jgi:hypothetical protein